MKRVVVSFVGMRKSGKSTLLKSLARIISDIEHSLLSPNDSDGLCFQHCNNFWEFRQDDTTEADVIVKVIDSSSNQRKRRSEDYLKQVNVGNKPVIEVYTKSTFGCGIKYCDVESDDFPEYAKRLMTNIRTLVE